MLFTSLKMCYKASIFKTAIRKENLSESREDRRLSENLKSIHYNIASKFVLSNSFAWRCFIFLLCTLMASANKSLLLVINNFSSVFPTFQVGYYADKPTESAVYCVYKINLKQNILCFNFLWVTDVINDRFLTSLVHLESLIT